LIFTARRLRVKDASAYIKLTYGRIELSVELPFKRSEGTLLNYETLDGRKLISDMDVLCRAVEMPCSGPKVNHDELY